MKLTVLMYHQVAEIPAGAVHTTNWVTPAQFEEQLALLASEGYETISLEQWVAWREGKGRVPSRPLVITFDDGYRSVRTHAWPRLQRFGFGATTFLVASEIGGTNRWDSGEVAQPLLDLAEITALAADGMQFGSHTWSHQPLRRIAAEAAMEELTRSRAAVTEILGSECRTISYPFSNADRRVHELAARAGYVAGVTGRGRMNPRRIPPLGLRRIKPDWRTSIDDLARTLWRERWLRP